MKITLNQAQRLSVSSQLLDGRRIPSGKKGVIYLLNHLGYVQIDTIAVINRAHHHTLWSRVSGYDPSILLELQAKDRQVFEYWGHAASYLPMTDFRFTLPMKNSFPNVWGAWTKQLYEKHKKVMPEVLSRIRKEGPLGSAHFKAPDGKKRGTWWDWKPAKMALELLLWQGELMVDRRHNFQRIYDLTERVLPPDTDTRVPHIDEVARFQVNRALQAHGIATLREIQDFFHISATRKVPQAIDELVDGGEVTEVGIQGLDSSKYYVSTPTLERLSRIRKPVPRVHLLSPFDSMVINRRRMERLFDFSYTLECYIPAAKRKYGYFSLPVLWGQDFVARLDPKADRKQNKFIVRNLVFEERFTDINTLPALLTSLLPALASRIKDLAGFNNCDTIQVEKCKPAKVKSALKKALK